MKIGLQFGAGNIGRGFIGDLLHRSGYKIVFVDSNKELVNMLRERGNYPLKLFDVDGSSKDLIIDNILSFTLEDEEEISNYISKADLIFTAVGVKNLPAIAHYISMGLKKRFKENRDYLNIFLCENLSSAPEILKNKVLEYLNNDEKKYVEDKVGFVGTTIGRMVAGSGKRYGFEDPLLIVAESYDVIPFSLKDIKGKIPNIYGLKPSKDFDFEIKKKLFIHNLGHAVIAYFGYLKNYTYIHEAIKDVDIKNIYDQAIKEVTLAIFSKYKGLDREEFENYISNLEERFKNPLLMDPISRVGRDPIRKLGPEDRIIGSAKFCLSQGIFPENIALTCSAVLLYDYPQDEEANNLQRLIKENGVEWVLVNICKLSLDEEFTKKVLYYYKKIKRISI
ncbi:MAG: mannitol-1-phosphate 5-dehydrogenase [Dictyoglomus sp. NZ13-RE01]|nr:MAG: mannitol-1-phosphate 5-dehydrogenase [Dictyoglomus sp. NZ13-RE01]